MFSKGSSFVNEVLIQAGYIAEKWQMLDWVSIGQEGMYF